MTNLLLIFILNVLRPKKSLLLILVKQNPWPCVSTPSKVGAGQVYRHKYWEGGGRGIYKRFIKDKKKAEIDVFSICVFGKAYLFCIVGALVVNSLRDITHHPSIPLFAHNTHTWDKNMHQEKKKSLW